MVAGNVLIYLLFLSPGEVFFLASKGVRAEGFCLEPHLFVKKRYKCEEVPATASQLIDPGENKAAEEAGGVQGDARQERGECCVCTCVCRCVCVCTRVGR